MSPIVVRRMSAGEMPMVLSNWKMQLSDEKYRFRWGKRLDGDNFWPLVNYVIDKITLPSCEVYVACYRTELTTPLCWVAIRQMPKLPTFEVVYLYARREIRNDAPLAAALETELLSEVQKARPLVSQRRPFSPYQELRP